PGTPVDRVAALRAAFTATMDDPDFQADVKSANLEYSPKNGAEVAAIVNQLSQAPPALIARYKSIIGNAIDR
ncbi:MAG TPA: hypothetical protein VG271_06955, partial [Beijerinckiaceae bacterium]|nr:hypothetical protein [Beijerinckiaceae bacterium]